uniref:Uncharacterized protein n=1 Tax=viral metagenome TaxID=1070528 RepID=A0A6C0EZ20_9ZZZZ
MSDFEISDFEGNNNDDDYDYDNMSNLSYTSDPCDPCDPCDNEEDDVQKQNVIIDMDDDDTTLQSILKPSQPKQKLLKISKTATPTKAISNPATKAITKEATIPKAATKKTSVKITEPETTLSKTEAKFQYNQENIDFFSRDLNPKKILIKNSPFTNDTKITCLLLKQNIIKEYKCNMPKCKVKMLWNGQPIQLMLHRINNIEDDLDIGNLELLCANCYMCNYGLEIFKKKEKEAIFKCNICDFPLVKFNNNRKAKGTCLKCERQMVKISQEKQQDNFYSKLQDTYSDNPFLSEKGQKSNYYQEVSKYKNFDKPKSGNSNTNSNTKTNTNSKPDPSTSMIQLNMSVPNISELISDTEEED